MTITLALVVWLIGLVAYLVARPTTPAKLVEVFHIMFWVGLLAWLLSNPWAYHFEHH